MVARALPRLGLAIVLATAAGTPGCASSDRDEGLTQPPEPRERPSRAQIYDRDRALVAGLATSLALGIVGLGTLLASGIFVAPAHERPSAPPKAIMIAGGVMSLGFFTTIPFAIGVERHRARYPEQFPGARGRSRVPPPTVALPARPSAPPSPQRGL